MTSLSFVASPGLERWRRRTDGPLLALALGTLPLLLIEVDRSELHSADARTGTEPTMPPTTWSPARLPVSGDFNGDGRDDIFWYNPGSGNDSIWHGTTTRGSFTKTATNVDGRYYEPIP